MLLGGAAGLEPNTKLVLVVLGAGAGYLGPSRLLDKRRAARQRSIRLALSDALDLLVVCVEAGLSLGAGISRVAREFTRSSPPLCEELRIVTAEMSAGKGNAESLRGLSERVGIEEVGSLVAMMVQSERFGTSIADALRIQADGMRKDRLQKAEERAPEGVCAHARAGRALHLPRHHDRHDRPGRARDDGDLQALNAPPPRREP